MRNLILGAALLALIAGSFAVGQLTADPATVRVTVSSPSPSPSPSPVIEVEFLTPVACVRFVQAAEDLVDARAAVGRIFFQMIHVAAQGGTIDTDFYLAQIRLVLDDIEGAEGPYNRFSVACLNSAKQVTAARLLEGEAGSR